MKKVVLSLALVTGLAFTTISCGNKAAEATDAVEITETTEASPFTVDVTQSKIGWAGRKILGSSHNGTINLSSGTVNVLNGAIVSGTFVIDMNSITCLDLAEEDGKANLEAHLKGTVEGKADDFFNVNQFPEAKFEISSVENGTISGNLTLKGVTKNISFPASISVSDNEVVINAETFTIDRTQWGVNFHNESAEGLAKDAIISNNIDIKLAVTAKK